MRKIFKIISVILAMTIFLSATALAYDYREWYTDEEREYGFETGRIIFTIHIEYINTESIESGAYEEILADILPELEYKYIDSVFRTNIVVEFQLVLKENTIQAVLDAVEMLENNSAIKSVRPFYLSYYYENLDVYEFRSDVFSVSLRQKYKGLSEEEYLDLLVEIEDKIDYIEIYNKGGINVYLKEKTCDAVLEAIKLLEDNPCVRRSNVILKLYNAMIEPKYLYGDVNFDGDVTNKDIVLIVRYLVGLAELDENQADTADVNRNGKIENSDVILLARMMIRAD